MPDRLQVQESGSVRPRFYIWDDVVAYMETLEGEPRSRGVDQVWIDAVVASKEAAIRERNLAVRQRDRYRKALEQVTEAYDNPKKMVGIAWEALDG